MAARGGNFGFADSTSRFAVSAPSLQSNLFAGLARGPSSSPVPPMGTFDVLPGTPGDDDFTGTDGGDIFNMEAGGDDTLNGLAGNDVFNFGTAFDGDDRVLGGGGDDTLVLNGSNYNTSFQITSDMLHNIEEIRLTGAFSYSIRLTGTQSSKTTTIDAADTTHLTIDSEGAHDSRVHIFGSAFQDFISVGDGPTRVEAGDGNDQMEFGVRVKTPT